MCFCNDWTSNFRLAAYFCCFLKWLCLKLRGELRVIEDICKLPILPLQMDFKRWLNNYSPPIHYLPPNTYIICIPVISNKEKGGSSFMSYLCFVDVEGHIANNNRVQ